MVNKEEQVDVGIMYINELVPSVLKNKNKRCVWRCVTQGKTSINHSHQRSRNWFRVAYSFLYLFMETSSIHGFNHLATKGRAIWEYILWCLLIMLGISGAISISQSTWQRYQQNPTVIAMERNSQDWNTTFPAVTVCPTLKVSPEKVREYAESLESSVNEQNVVQFLEKLSNATYENFITMSDDPSKSISPSDYQKIVLKNSYDFSYMVMNSVEGYEPDVIRHLSEMGICYTYNTVIAMFNNPDVWYNRTRVMVPSVVLSGNELDGDLFSRITEMNSPVNVFFHDPQEIPDCAVRKLDLSEQEFRTIDLRAFSITVSEEVRSLSFRQRKCRFSDESNLRLSSRYSYKLCRMECRFDQAVALCGCMPYFYKPLAGVKACDPEGMRCLGKHRDSENIDTKLICECLPMCDSTTYFIYQQDVMEWFSRTHLKWGLSEYPQMRLKRDVLFGFTELIVSVGGSAGLFLGCSILSFIEIIYSFTLRIICLTYIGKKRKARHSLVSRLE